MITRSSLPAWLFALAAIFAMMAAAACNSEQFGGMTSTKKGDGDGDSDPLTDAEVEDEIGDEDTLVDEPIIVSGMFLNCQAGEDQAERDSWNCRVESTGTKVALDDNAMAWRTFNRADIEFVSEVEKQDPANPWHAIIRTAKNSIDDGFTVKMTFTRPDGLKEYRECFIGTDNYLLGSGETGGLNKRDFDHYWKDLSLDFTLAVKRLVTITLVDTEGMICDGEADDLRKDCDENYRVVLSGAADGDQIHYFQRKEIDDRRTDSFSFDLEPGTYTFKIIPGKLNGWGDGLDNIGVHGIIFNGDGHITFGQVGGTEQ